MKAIIAHDRSGVATQIKSIILEVVGKDCHVTVVEDTNSLRRELSGHVYDILILDLTLSREVGRDEPGYEYVKQLLSEMEYNDNIATPANVIAITQEREVGEKVIIDIESHVMSVIDEDVDGFWKRTLALKLAYAKKATQTNNALLHSSFDYDVLIITALDKEFAPYRSLFELHTSSVPIAHPNLYTFRAMGMDNRSLKCAIFSVGRSGQEATGSWTQNLLHVLRPSLVIMTGICGGIKEKTFYCDTLVFSSSHDWDSGRWEEAKPSENVTVPFTNGGLRFQPRTTPISIEGSKLHSAARALVETNRGEIVNAALHASRLGKGEISTFSVKLVEAASGSSVLACESFVRDLRLYNDRIYAVDMESYSLYYACKHTTRAKPLYVCIKSVSDFCDADKNDDYHDAGSFLSAWLCKRLLSLV